VRAVDLPQPAEAASLSAYEGAYRAYRWGFTSIEKILGLSSQFSVRDSGKGTLIVGGRLGPGEYAPIGQLGMFRNLGTGDYLYMRPNPEGRMLLTFGNFPFLTTFKLDQIDTQEFSFLAYWSFVVCLTLTGLILIATAVRNGSKKEWRTAEGKTLLAIALISCGLGLYFFVNLAMSLPESAIQMSIPSAAYWLLAIPLAACALVAGFLLGWAVGPYRQITWPDRILALFSLGLFASFIAWIVHWHAFGWQFP
jgi:uncharacterized membrane protein YsdA (DUF1294 family)